MASYFQTLPLFHDAKAPQMAASCRADGGERYPALLDQTGPCESGSVTGP